jgi:hypothetical protein
MVFTSYGHQKDICLSATKRIKGNFGHNANYGESNSSIKSTLGGLVHGIEDYELLTMYAKTKGDAAAKELAMGVLAHAEDTSKADTVRRRY